MQGKPLSLQALAALLLKHTGDCGSLRGLPERLQVSSVTAQAVQVIDELACVGLLACPALVLVLTFWLLGHSKFTSVTLLFPSVSRPYGHVHT